MERIYNEQYGWGDIVYKGNGYYLVRFDADPWSLVKIKT